MSERTTIGGTVYEAIGSSSSNLLLKCNGTARIQWGSKLIDLIKNGKIASEGSLELIFIIKDESEIKSDGVYVLTTEESNQLWVCKDGITYNLTVADLYISASNSQNLTGEQKLQALQNIGMYYNTLQDLLNALIQNGFVYVLDSKTLYMIQNGVIEEFKATIKDVTVDEDLKMGDVINGSVKLVLSVQNEEYLVLADHRITANYSIHVRESAQIGSEEADINLGYRLYISGGVSHLDVDEINVRNGIKIKLYKEITFENFASLLNQHLLEPLTWYLITDFLNHWKLTRGNTIYNRPILIRAFDEKSTYKKGYLFRDHNIVIHYDPFFQDPIKLFTTLNGVTTESMISARGKITWMKDYNNNNEANFDFLDYTDCNGKELAVLHYPNSDTDIDKSIFPKNSHDNKLKVYNLKGTVLKEGLIDDTNTTSIDFQFDDSEDKIMEMYGNDIECKGLILKPECTSFCNNVLRKTFLLEISNIFNNNEFLSLYKTKDYSNIDYEKYTFENFDLFDLILPIEFKFKTEKVIGEDVRNCFFNNELINSNLGNIENCNFNQVIEDSTILLVKRPEVNYFYNFKKLFNSTINDVSLEVEFPDEIRDSVINTIRGSVQMSKGIIGCIIETIASNVTIKELLINSTINEICNNAIIEFPINNCNINSINNSTIKGNLSDSNFNDIKDSSIESGISNTNINDIHTSLVEGAISDSNIYNIDNSKIKESINNSIIKNITNDSTLKAIIDKSTFEDISNSTIEGSIYNSSFKDISKCQFYTDFDNAKFQELQGCTFSSGTVKDVISFYPLSSESFNTEDHFLLYDILKRKEIYIHNEKLQIICVPDVVFYRGMIIMHYLPDQIPLGWALCDGGEYTWNGVTTKTPDLRNRFIKAAETLTSSLKESEPNTDLNENKKLQLKKEHLPEHHHPHKEHTHNIDKLSVSVDTAEITVETDTSVAYWYTGAKVATGGESTTDVIGSITWLKVNSVGSHSHTTSISGGSLSGSTSEEDTQTWLNNEINIEPEHYTLIFIMKL